MEVTPTCAGVCRFESYFPELRSDVQRSNLLNLFGSWCFKPSQPQRIMSGLRKTFTKRYIVERTNKADI